MMNLLVPMAIKNCVLKYLTHPVFVMRLKNISLTLGHSFSIDQGAAAGNAKETVQMRHK